MGEDSSLLLSETNILLISECYPYGVAMLSPSEVPQVLTVKEISSSFSSRAGAGFQNYKTISGLKQPQNLCLQIIH